MPAIPGSASGAAAQNSAPLGGAPVACPKQDTFSVTALTVPSPIAPGKETIKIAYTVSDPAKKVSSGKIEIFRKKDGVLLKTLTLAAADYAAGPHELPWDGAIDAHADFPDSFVTIEHTPYELKITLTGACAGSPDTQKAEFKVEVHSLELELGLRDDVVVVQHKKVYDQLGGSLPAAGKKAKLRLESNLFKVTDGEMNASSGASYSEYQSLWGDGASVPMVGKLWFKSSTGAKVLCPKGWGKRKLVWDWIDVPEDTAGVNARASSYIKTSVDFDKKLSKPNGDNCHAERGGKRSSKGTPAMFDALGSYTGKAGAKRAWAFFSEPAPSGADEGLSGVMLRPSRMAGDAVQVKVYFEPDPGKDLDVETALSAAFHKETGDFVTWREIHVSSYKKKKASIPGYSHGKLESLFKPAFTAVLDKTGGASSMAQAAYDTDFAAAVQAHQDAILLAHAIDPSISQYNAADWAVTFRVYADFVASRVAEEEAKLVQAGTQQPTAATQAAANVAAALGKVNLANATDYADKCTDWACDIAVEGCKNLLGSNDGITLLQFDRLCSQEPFANFVINGVAPSGMLGAGRNRQAFIQFALGSSYSGSFNSLEQTISHEIGHHLMLPHQASGGKTPGGHDPTAHDQADPHCMLSYNYTAPREFCGLCILRIRGWDHRKLDKDAAKNKR